MDNIEKLKSQLARKEQECEELKRLYKELQDDMLACNKCRATIKLQQQLDQFKADRAEALKQLEFVRTLNTVQEAKIRELSKNLTEIEEIAEDFYLDGEYVKDKYLAQEILQKISECEVENET